MPLRLLLSLTVTLCLLLAAAACASAASPLTPVWHSYRESQIYTTASLGGDASVSTAWWGRPPAGAETKVMPDGAARSAWTPPGANDTSLEVQVAAAGPRVSRAGGVTAVYASFATPVASAAAALDARLPAAGASPAQEITPEWVCTMAGFVDGAAEPAWTRAVPSCFTDVSGGSTLLRVSGDGSTAALLVAVNDTASGALFAELHVVDAATGAVVTVFRSPPQQGAVSLRSVALSADGSVASFVVTASLYALDTATGALRQPPLDVGFSGPAFMCPMGVFIVFGAGDVYVLEWKGSSYEHQFTVMGGQFLMSSASIATNGGPDAPLGCLLAVGWQSNDATQPRVSVHSLLTRKELFQWTGPANQRLQIVTSAVSSEASYVAAATWGDGGNTTQPTVLLWDARRAGSEPAATFTTPGSMWAASVSVQPGGSVYVAAAGKHEHANIRGTGGDVYLLEYEGKM